MNVEHVELTNFGSWAELDLAIQPGVSLISGANGAGKSTILQAVSFAMFGVSSGAERLIRRGTDQARVEVKVDVEGVTVYAAREIRRSGTAAKVSLSLAREIDGDLEVLTAATVGESQAILDGLLGVSREVLEASAFSMQHSGASFCEAAPRDRKRVLTAALPSLEIWQPLADGAAAEKRTASDAANVARAELERLDGASSRAHEAYSRREVASMCVGDTAGEVERAEAAVERLAAEAEAAREARRQHQAAVEQQQRAQADHARATAERATADEALERAKTAAANAPSVDEARAASLAAAQRMAEAEAHHASATAALAHWREQVAQAKAEISTEQSNIDGARIAAASHRAMIKREESGECSRCGAPADAWKQSPLDAARASLIEAETLETESNVMLDTWLARSQHLGLNPPATPDDVELAAARAAASTAYARLAEAETIQSLAGSIEAAQQRSRDASDREAETATELRETNAILAESTEHGPMDAKPEQAHQAALAAYATARANHSAAAAELARAEEAAKVAERQAADETAARERLEVAEVDAAIAGILAAGFGPQGVPAMIVDGILGDLSDGANRVLAELSSPIRVELRSQRLLKSADRLADTLDIVIHMDSMEAPYETLSGGERTRVALALRAALTRLLASKSGARVKIMVVDEPASLDSAGAEQLAVVLQEFVTAGVFESIILVAHQAELAEAIERVIRIEKTPGGESRLVESAGHSALSMGSDSGSSPVSGVAPDRAHTGATNA